jgi:hypothetical protein
VTLPFGPWSNELGEGWWYLRPRTRSGSLTSPLYSIPAVVRPDRRGQLRDRPHLPAGATELPVFSLFIAAGPETVKHGIKAA